MEINAQIDLTVAVGETWSRGHTNLFEGKKSFYTNFSVRDRFQLCA